MSQRFLVDTNVLSELMRTSPAPQVYNWFANHSDDQIYVSSISQAEILAGIAVLPEGKRRNALADSAPLLLETDMADRCLVFGAAAAKHYAIIYANRRRMGRPISTQDAQIAAIALAEHLALVTRNTQDFEGIEGLAVVNPWLP
jgi:predicted nucleic acid-binding protein